MKIHSERKELFVFLCHPNPYHIYYPHMFWKKSNSLSFFDVKIIVEKIELLLIGI